MEACYSRNMCLKVLNVSFCIYVVLDKLLSIDWRYLYRIDAYEHEVNVKRRIAIWMKDENLMA